MSMITWFSAAEAFGVVVIGALQLIWVRSWFEQTPSRRGA